jgi:hypothetical protein
VSPLIAHRSSGSRLRPGVSKGGLCALARGAAMRRAKPARCPPWRGIQGAPRAPWRPPASVAKQSVDSENGLVHSTSPTLESGSRIRRSRDEWRPAGLRPSAPLLRARRGAAWSLRDRGAGRRPALRRGWRARGGGKRRRAAEGANHLKLRAAPGGVAGAGAPAHRCSGRAAGGLRPRGGAGGPARPRSRAGRGSGRPGSARWSSRRCPCSRRRTLGPRPRRR